MTCKSAIYTANTTQQALAANSQIPFGGIVRRFGRACQLEGDSIVLTESGYYAVDCSVTLEPTAIGPVSIQLMKDGVVVPGTVKTGYSAAAGNPVTLNFSAMVRVFGQCNADVLAVVLGDEAATVVDMGVRVEKI